MKKYNAKNHTGLGRGVQEHSGITHSPYSRPFLIANALTQPFYSRGLLKAPEECLLINYCSKSQRQAVDWAELWLVKEQIDTVRVNIQLLEKIVYTSRF